MAAVLTLRFLLELALLTAIGYLCWRLMSGWWRWPLAILVPVAVATFWGAFLSPKARYSLSEVAKFLIELVLFGGVGFWLYQLGFEWIGAGLYLVWLFDRVAIGMLRWPPSG